MAGAPRETSVAKKGFTWAQAVRDVLIAAMNRGQLPTLILMAIVGIFVWRMPADDVSKLAFRILQRLEDGCLVGWMLAVLLVVAWYVHSRKMRQHFAEEYERIGLEKSRLQDVVAGKALTSSNSRKPR